MLSHKVNHGLEKSSWSLEAEMPGLDYVACQFLVLHCWAGPSFAFQFLHLQNEANLELTDDSCKVEKGFQEVPGLLWPVRECLPCLMSSLACVLLPGLKGNDHLLYKMSPYFLWLAIENVHTGS